MNIEATASQASLAAAARLYRLHAGEVYRYAARRLGENLAVDVTAEVFRVAIERYPTFDPHLGHERAWLYGIASNLIRTHWRSEQRRLRAVRREQSLARAPCDPLLRVEERVDADNALIDVMNAVAELSPDDRDLLTLFAWEGCSYAEIAEALRIPIGTVRSRLNRIRKGLAPAFPMRCQEDD